MGGVAQKSGFKGGCARKKASLKEKSQILLKIYVTSILLKMHYILKLTD
jgi:hypothetical protein